MLVTRNWKFGLGLAVALSPVALASAEDRIPVVPVQVQVGPAVRPIGFANPMQLLPADALDALKLSDDQKTKIDGLQKEFEKEKDALAKTQEAFRKAIQDRDQDAIKKASGEMQEAFQQIQKSREDVRGKIRAVLTEAQQQKFDEIVKEADKPVFRPIPFAPPGTVLPENVKDAIKLDKEQREKIAELQKMVNGELEKILTKEQLEQLKKMGPNIGIRLPQGQPVPPAPRQGGGLNGLAVQVQAVPVPVAPGQAAPGQAAPVPAVPVQIQIMPAPGGVAAAPGTILTPPVKEALKLTKEQEAKIAELQKKVTEDLEKILTKEQLEQLKKMNNPVILPPNPRPVPLPAPVPGIQPVPGKAVPQKQVM